MAGRGGLRHWQGVKVTRMVGELVEERMNDARNHLERALKSKLSQPGTGRIYIRGGIPHRASAPGEPPAVDTGQLRANAGSRLFRRRNGDIVMMVGADVPYAIYLEMGTSKMAARPFLRPTINENRASIMRILSS